MSIEIIISGKDNVQFGVGFVLAWVRFLKKRMHNENSVQVEMGRNGAIMSYSIEEEVIVKTLLGSSDQVIRLITPQITVTFSNDKFSKVLWIRFKSGYFGENESIFFECYREIQHFEHFLEVDRVDFLESHLDQSISMRHDIPFYFIPNITLNWKTILSPEYYAEYWDREVLLKAPAFALKEYENGWIELQTYRDLLDPLSEESLGQVRKLACYLEKYHKQAKYGQAKRPHIYQDEAEYRPGCAECGYE